jgi:hypothetical protein
MNNNQIDVRAISYLNLAITENKYLMPLIEFNDKTPVWDGFILLYRDEEHTKKWIRRIPVQVKGTTQQKYKISDEKLSFYIHKSDLENFSADRGVIFFVVVMHDCEQKIYYKMLLPQDIRPILKNANFTQEEKTSVKFTTFPTEPEEMQKILNLFVKNRCDDNMIRNFTDVDFASVAGFDVSTSEVVDFKDSASIAKALNSDSTYMYVNPKNSMDVQIPLAKNDDISAFVGNNGKITENIWASHFTNGANTEVIHIGSNPVFDERSIKMEFNKTTSQANFNIKFQGTLTQQILDIEWLLDSEPVKKVLHISDERKEQYEEYKTALVRIKTSLTKCGINEDIDISKLTDKEKNDLAFLCYSVTDIQDYDKSNNHLFGWFSFSKYKILLYKKQLGEDFSKLIWTNPFAENEKICLMSKNEKGEFDPRDGAICSIFMLAQRGDYAKFVNTNYDIIYEFLTSTEINDAVLELLLQVQCHMISAFDDDNINTEVLDLALKFGKWIYDNTDLDKDALLINTIQIQKRKGKQLSSSDCIKLLEFTKSDNYQLKFASFTLFGERDNALAAFSCLIPELQEIYKTMPIYALFNQLEQEKPLLMV